MNHHKFIFGMLLVCLCFFCLCVENKEHVTGDNSSYQDICTKKLSVGPSDVDRKECVDAGGTIVVGGDGSRCVCGCRDLRVIYTRDRIGGRRRKRRCRDCGEEVWTMERLPQACAAARRGSPKAAFNAGHLSNSAPLILPSWLASYCSTALVPAAAASIAGG